MEREGANCKATVRGWKEDDYLLVETPDPKWRHKTNDDIIGRLTHGGKYYGFTTSMIGILPEISMIVLRYPDDVVDTTLRESDRHEVTLPVKITYMTGANPHVYTGVITDISMGGCKLMSQKYFNADDVVFLSGMFPTGRIFEKIGFIIKSVRGVDKFEYGGMLRIPLASDREALAGFMDKMKQLKG